MIYICIPAWNEERTVGVLLWKIRSVMREFGRDYQILVLDDGSTDGTPDVLSPYARVMPLTVLRHRERRGYATSSETLLREAVSRSTYPRRDAVVTLQADFTDEPDEIPALIKRIEAGADVVTSRARFNGDPMPASVRWASRFLRSVARRGGWPEPVTDPLSGFRAYRVIALRKAIEARDGGRLLTHDGWAANAELLRSVVPFARRLDETEVQAHYQRRTRTSRFRAWLTALQVLRVVRGKPPAIAAGELSAPEELRPAPLSVEPRKQGVRKRDGRRRSSPEQPRREQKQPRPRPQRQGNPAPQAEAAPEAEAAAPKSKRRRRGGARRRGRRGGGNRGANNGGTNGAPDAGGETRPETGSGPEAVPA